ncbi:hypothetical protein SCARD494_07460 [Seiridium cardinale]
MASKGQPEYGRRLVPNIIDSKARETPDKEIFQTPRSEKPSDGWESVTFKTYANAINRCCHTIIEQCGKPPEGKTPVIAYIGANDARYLALTVAAIKTGYTAFFVSPRNTLEGQLNLFKQSDCHLLAFPESHRALVEPWLEKGKMTAVHMPSMEEIFSSEEVPHYPYNKTFEEAEFDPFVILHTSGSTGFPKPVVCRTGQLAISDAHHLLPEWEGRIPVLRGWAERSEHVFSPMPLFHAAGIFFSILINIYWDVSLVLGIPQRQLSSELVIECLANSDADAALLPPSIIEDLSEDDEGVRSLAKLNFVAFGGGALSAPAGGKLAERGVTLQNLIAATETAPFPLYWNSNRELWQWFIFNNEQLGGDWRKVPGDDDIYEQVIVRKGSHPGLQPCFYTFPELNEYSTHDLYQPHPTLAHHWRHVGRSDNIIVFSNGEKLNPVTIEQTLEEDPRVKSALVVGANRFQPAVIIEPATHPLDIQEREKFLEDIWPMIDAANKETVAHGRIDRGLVALSDPSKPFFRAGKGTVQRPATAKLYESEINEMYDRIEQTAASELPPLDASSESALVGSIKTLLGNQVEYTDIQPDTDFFSVGVDSLQVIGLSRRLRTSLEAAGFREHAMMMTPRAINSNPTPQRLAEFIMRKIVRGESSTSAEDEALEQQRDMLALYKKYTTDLQATTTRKPDAAGQGQTVILTGSTGMLGSYMLDAMAQSSRVKRIICLNRAEDGGAEQQSRSANERTLDKTFGGKAEFYHVDASLANLGLPETLYTRLLAEADRIIHNAWPVNFHMPVKSFEKYIRGVRNFADFAAKASKRVAVIFIASVATVMRWDPRRGIVPEARFDDMSLADGGYGRSKMVSALILDDASQAGNFPAASIRVGQIAGPDAGNGVWNRHEWFPSIVASSLYLKALPADLGAMNGIDWTPTERIANLVLEVGGITQEVKPETISGYFHGVNPSTTEWSTLAQAIREFYGAARLPEMISFKEWVTRLEATQAVDGNPGVKLLDTYRGMLAGDDSANRGRVVISMERTMGQSPTMRNSAAITPELMKQWCRNWDF